VAGDFSHRVHIKLEDEELEALAGSVNSLVETVDRSIAETGGVLAALAGTDLSRRVTGEYAGALAQLKDDTNSVADRLSEVVRQLRSASTAVRTATGELLHGADDLAERTSRQAAGVEETAAAVERLNDTTDDIAATAASANATAGAVARTAAETGAVMGEANAAMDRISTASAKIANIVSLIDDISFQTNLLALNASVEAARAGDAGKGFAVVAVEVRRLAQSAAGASAQVKQLVELATTEIIGGNRLVAAAAHSLGTMLVGIHENSELVGRIAEATGEQSLTITEISKTVRAIDEMTQHNAALVEETNVAIAQTEAQANALDELVGVFVLAEPAADRALVRRRPRAA
jgi:methyl-accepting chemotaxis protein